MEINGYKLENSIKIQRAESTLGADFTENDLLVAYDKLGGLITKGGQKIKTGCFYDTKRKAAAVKPVPVYLYNVNGHIVEVPEGTELPGEVRAANILAEEQGKDRAKAAKAKKAAKKTEEDAAAAEEGEDE